MKRKNVKNGKEVVKVTPIGINKVQVWYTDGTHEVMLKALSDQIVREVE